MAPRMGFEPMIPMGQDPCGYSQVIISTDVVLSNLTPQRKCFHLCLRNTRLCDLGMNAKW